jgi:dTMP kinase
MMGPFIVLEGCDGAGTTTQAEALAQHLFRLGYRSRLTCEPSGGPIGRQIRRALGGGASWRRLLDNPSSDVGGIGGPPADGKPPEEFLALLFAADRIDHLRTQVEPELALGSVVVCDRYDLSTLVYQGWAPQEVPGEPIDVGRTSFISWLRDINQHARRPDLTIVLNVSPEIAEARRAARGRPTDVYDERSFQEAVIDGYRRAGWLLPDDRIVHVDGARDVETVAADIFKLVEPLLPPRQPSER